MEVSKLKQVVHQTPLDLDAIPREITEEDQDIFRKIISTDLSSEQKQRVVRPSRVYSQQQYVLAIHWHPEFIPMELIQKRIDAAFPNRSDELIIPTQHNIPLRYDGFTGVEVDCYSKGFNRKVQLLFHFENSKFEHADVFRAMLWHTFQYRSSQLFDFIDTILEPSREERLQKAASETGADEELVSFVRIYTLKLLQLIDENRAITPPEAIKNKLVRNYFDELRNTYDSRLINRAQVFLNAVKAIVKKHFTLEYFYETEEVIEEGRALGAGIVIPHPEQFWPILLADYDVDGYEVWNPQSQEYTEFLINVVNRHNRARRGSEKPILVFMGDDTHMSEKIKDPLLQEKEKSGREIGVQAAWDDLSIRKTLIVANSERPRIISEYRSRLLS